jgi:hypothetical protein
VSGCSQPEFAVGILRKRQWNPKRSRANFGVSGASFRGSADWQALALFLHKAEVFVVFSVFLFADELSE